MQPGSKLLFPSFYARSIYSFPIPEVLSNETNVRKVFRISRLMNRLKRGEPSEERFRRFRECNPIFNFTKVAKSAYTDEFWHPFWGRWDDSLPVHFPFAMKLEGLVSRIPSWEQFSSFVGNELRDYKGIVRGRLYPYGAVSLHLCEYVKFAGDCTSTDIVAFLAQRLRYDSRIMTVRQFFHEIRDEMLGQILETRENYPLLAASPQYVVINPEVKAVPNVSTMWDDISPLLAVSKNPYHTLKYLPKSYSTNFGRKTQMVLCGPYSTVLFTPDLSSERRVHALRCLRNRISNIAELVVIQETFLEEYWKTYKRIMFEIQASKGYPLARIESFLRDRIRNRLKSELNSLQTILGFSNELESRMRWLRWYLAIASGKKEEFQRFMSLLHDMNEANVELGEDVIQSIKNLTQALVELISRFEGSSNKES